VLTPGLPIAGEILTSRVRSIDTLARSPGYRRAASDATPLTVGAAVRPGIAYAGAAVPEAILDEVRSKLAVLIGL